MIAIFRCILIPLVFIIFSLLGIIFCFFRPGHPNNTKILALSLSRVFAPIVGIKLIVKNNPQTNTRPCVYIANHQSNYDLACFGAAFHDRTVCIGKNSIRWIPFFGQLFWLSGSLFINRKNRISAISTIKHVTQRIVNYNISIWLFPEGTRSAGKGLLPFKMGAFHTAIQAQVPLLPIILSSTSHFRLNKINNGYAIIKILDPIETTRFDTHNIKQLSRICHNVIKLTITQLDKEVALLNSKDIH
jgi:1-acyl-sn-glycerol-3-phosphate acyltransferase